MSAADAAVRVEPLPLADAERVARNMPWRRASRHLDRAAAQAAGRGVYLIAWRDREPVGHAFLKWRGELTSRQALAEECAEVEDLYVRADLRDNGIGGALLAAAADETQARGETKLGLAVALANVPARRVYARHGFVDAGHGVFTLAWTTRDGAGREGRVEEDCVYLVKEL